MDRHVARPALQPARGGGTPENALTGQNFLVNSGTSRITVPVAVQEPAPVAQHRRHEPDLRADASRSRRQHPRLRVGRGRRQRLPARRRVQALLDHRQRRRGLHATTAARRRSTATATHNLTLYRAPSGALRVRRRHRPVVLGPRRLEPGRQPRRPIRNMQQATVNLLADMGAQPATLQSGLTAASASTDTTAPTSTISVARRTATHRRHAGRRSRAPRPTPAAASSPASRSRPTAARPGTRRPARRSWTYAWTAHGSPPTTIKVARRRRQRQPETPGAGRHGQRRPARARSGARASRPRDADSGDTDVGRGRASSSSPTRTAPITGVRFYKAAANTGTHIGSLWTRRRHAAGAGDLHAARRPRAGRR